MSSQTIVAGVRQFLMAHPPFAQMSPADVDFAIGRMELAYFANDEVLVAPENGVPDRCFVIKQGGVRGARGGSASGDGDGDSAFSHVTPGDVFPVGAMLAERPVSATYRAVGDTFCWVLQRADFIELTRRSPVFLDYCRRRLAVLLDLSRRALQANYAAEASRWRDLSGPLSSVVRREPVTARPTDTIRQVFETMERHHVGSVLICEVEPPPQRPVAGVFTRQDVIGRVSLPGLSLETPISEVMTSPVMSLTTSDSIADAILLMAERGIRHVPVIEGTTAAGVVTERDLFVLQRLNMRSIGERIDRAADADALAAVSGDIREWSHALVAQGMGAEFITRLISRVNDRVTVRALQLAAARHAVDLHEICWLAFGSEGREEQTIATDQDNGLVFPDDKPEARDALLRFAQEVNQTLAQCGYTLCGGGIMAGNPKWCMSESGWRDCFATWIDRGDPDSLLAASIFFDFRALAGDTGIATRLRDFVSERAAAMPRFLKQMSDNALRNGPPASWTGGVIGQIFTHEAAEVDLKLHGTMSFVDAARLLSLAHRVKATGTVARLQELVSQGRLQENEVIGWIEAFQFLQSLRLRNQHMPTTDDPNPNMMDTGKLSALDRRILKESFRQARKLQQRLAVDFPG